eukprot:Tamp_09407.p1 GENE.Tamp_09407~~Tamp_09407.p1  ORF type:complete len:496 (+),score=72.84 Tamp_09407:45-1490(+)
MSAAGEPPEPGNECLAYSMSMPSLKAYWKHVLGPSAGHRLAHVVYACSRCQYGPRGKKKLPSPGTHCTECALERRWDFRFITGLALGRQKIAAARASSMCIATDATWINDLFDPASANTEGGPVVYPCLLLNPTVTGLLFSGAALATRHQAKADLKAELETLLQPAIDEAVSALANVARACGLTVPINLSLANPNPPPAHELGRWRNHELKIKAGVSNCLMQRLSEKYLHQNLVGLRTIVVSVSHLVGAAEDSAPSAAAQRIVSPERMFREMYAEQPWPEMLLRLELITIDTDARRDGSAGGNFGSDAAPLHVFTSEDAGRVPGQARQFWELDKEEYLAEMNRLAVEMDNPSLTAQVREAEYQFRRGKAHALAGGYDMVSMYQVITANGPVFLDTINQTDNGRAILSAGAKTRKTRKDAKPPLQSTDSTEGGAGWGAGGERATVRAAAGETDTQQDEGEGSGSGVRGGRRLRRAVPSSDSD